MADSGTIVAGRRAPPRKVLAPWLDRAGRFSSLKAATLALLTVPGLYIALTWMTVGLGPRPITEAIHQTGDWTVRILLVTLAITPARRILDWSRLILVRRMLGLGALAYILTHFTLYNVDLNFEFARVGSEILLRIYLTIGFLALLGLCALGVTSTDAAIRRMGKSWVTLHNLIYPVGILALLHFFMQSKLNVTQPVLMSGYFLWLMLYRLMRRFGLPTGAPGLVGLAAAAAILTALVEFSWYGLMTRVDPWRVLAANLDFGFAIRPAWYVFAAGLGVAILYLARRTPLPWRARIGTVSGS